MGCKGCKDKNKEILKNEYKNTPSIVVIIVIIWLLLGLFGLYEIISSLFR